ncbi:putative ferric-chelate reductase 1 isoform X8 [Bufo bufo]|uniref:putative ferric-chelate reductase 1 isoform X7 n=1 Tax=Bufo bufo TaxID=8384 RepID=UPI001ABE7B9C|nr:putative ferric-chelate reductase 1 isoform X7 [Bufo bufo]XP_040263401.1 putative ferric-chelate reductase 1 isoform X8 [Bufo bufo]
MDPLVKSTVILLIVSLFDCSNGYPNGKVQDSCSSMVPKHGANAQTSAAPYSLSLIKSTYSAGEELTVTLTGNATFTGFMIQARNGNSLNPVGSFKVNGNAQTLDCTSTASAVSHTSAEPKQSIQVTWVAPADSNSDLHIRATVVQTKLVYWTGVPSSKLTYIATSGTNGTTAENSGFQQTAPPLFGLILMVTVLWI